MIPTSILDSQRASTANDTKMISDFVRQLPSNHHSAAAIKLFRIGVHDTLFFCQINATHTVLFLFPKLDLLEMTPHDLFSPR
jgi:hypothetical protein